MVKYSRITRKYRDGNATGFAMYPEREQTTLAEGTFFLLWAVLVNREQSANSRPFAGPVRAWPPSALGPRTERAIVRFPYDIISGDAFPGRVSTESFFPTNALITRFSRKSGFATFIAAKFTRSKGTGVSRERN